MSKGIAKEFDEVEPKVIQEGWSSYQLEDRSLVRARSIATKIRWPKGQKNIGTPGSSIVFAYQNVIVVLSPPEIRGKPNPKPPTPAEARNLPQSEVKIIKTNEDWNLYEIEHKGVITRFKMKTVVTSIRRVKETFADDGDPYYMVASALMVVPA